MITLGQIMAAFERAPRGTQDEFREMLREPTTGEMQDKLVLEARVTLQSAWTALVNNGFDYEKALRSLQDR